MGPFLEHSSLARDPSPVTYLFGGVSFIVQFRRLFFEVWGCLGLRPGGREECKCLPLLARAGLSDIEPWCLELFRVYIGAPCF